MREQKEEKEDERKKKKKTPGSIGSAVLLAGSVLVSDNDNDRIEKRNSRFFTISSLRSDLFLTRTLK